MQIPKSAIPFVLLITNCNAKNLEKQNINTVKDTPVTVAGFKTIGSIDVPQGYNRVQAGENSFGAYLREVELKKDKKVYLFNGNLKSNQSAQFAVLNITVGQKDLQQCADAVMRLRAEWLYRTKKMDQILFIDNNRKQYRFTAPFTRTRFDNYLQRVFGMCGSASLEMQLKARPNLDKIQIGDVFIKGGFPGHAVIVVDVAEHTNGEKSFLLAQSYMPAQDIHILKNPNNQELNPWYAIKDIDNYLYTPEYTFTKNQLRTW